MMTDPPRRPAKARSPGPPIHHLGFRVEDLESAASQFAAAFGIGPFLLLDHVKFDTVLFEGAPASFDHSAAFAAWGDIFVELQQIHGAGPAALADAVGCMRPPGLNHIAYAVDEPAMESSRLTESGLPLLFHATVGEVELTWHDAWADLGCGLEIHRASRDLAEFFERIRDATRHWDGQRLLLRGDR